MRQKFVIFSAVVAAVASVSLAGLAVVKTAVTFGPSGRTEVNAHSPDIKSNNAALADQNHDPTIATTTPEQQTAIQKTDAESTSTTKSDKPTSDQTIKPAAVNPKKEPAATDSPFITIPGELTLTVLNTTAGVLLAWTPRTPKAFGGYKVVRSETDGDPYYPKSGYLTFITDSSETQWIDEDAVSGKNYFYRICSLTTDGSPAACGNVVKFKPR